MSSTHSVLKQLETFIRRTGSGVDISYDAGGGGVGLTWCVTTGEWPWCHGETLEHAITVFLSEHARLSREKLEKELKETYGHE